MLLTTTVNAQFIPEECDEKPEFEAKEDLTLCEQYERETIDITIGTDANSYTYASTVGFTNLFAQKVRINGTLDLNVPLLFYGAVLEFGPGAEIIIQANQTMLASDTKMYACTNMWKGITVKSGGYLSLLYDSWIEDAQYAISAENNATLNVQETYFNRNYIGIRTKSTTSATTILNILNFSGNVFTCSDPLNDGYSGQLPSPGEVSYAGIFLSRSIASNIGRYNLPANQFFRMHYGILAFKSTVIVQNCQFSQMVGLEGDEASATGIYCSGGTLRVNAFYDSPNTQYLGSSIFDDCGHSGIETTGVNNLSVIGNDFTGEQIYGVRSLGNLFSGQFRITSNTFEVSEPDNASGIFLERSMASRGLHNIISHNSIQMAGSTAGKYGIHVTSPFAAGDRMEIIGNEVTVTSSADIIFPIQVTALLADKFWIIDNTINFNSTNAANERWGIVMLDGYGDAHLIKENTIMGTDTHNPGHCGIHIDNVRNTTICDNVVDHTQWGIHLMGTLDPCKLQNNHINAHERGLFLSPGSFGVAGIGTQLRHGNEWSTTSGDYTEWAAQCDSNLDPLLSRFITESEHTSKLPSSGLLDPPSGWFSYIGGDVNYCVPVPSGSDENLSALQGETATGNLGDYIETSSDEWEMEYALMLTLRNNPALLTNMDALSFYNSNSTTTTAGALSYSLHQLKNILLPGSTEQSEIDEIYEGILLLTDTLVDLENSYPITPDTTLSSIDTNFLNDKQQLLESILDLMDEAQIWQDDIATARESDLEDLEDFNDNITVTQVYEQNHKTFNNYLIKRALGTATSTDYEDIVDIATLQSPDTSGSSVSFARHLLPLCQQINYIEDEEASEEALQAFRPAVASMQPEAFEAYPNPADGSTNIRLPKGIAGKLQIRNADGKIMYDQEIEANAVQQLSINTAYWPAGAYLCILTESNGQANRQFTFVVSH